MINFDKIFKNLELLHGAAQDTVTPVELVREIISKMPEQDFADPNATFLDPCCGKGTFLVAIAERAFHAMAKIIPDEQKRIEHIITYKVIGMDIHTGQVRTTITTLKKLAGADVKVNISAGDAMSFFGKRFDNVVGNPPYNISDKKTGNGTGGDVTLYKKFYKAARKLAKPSGNIALVTPKGIIPVLEKDRMDVKTLNLMSDKDYWKYNTCYFITKNAKSSNGLSINDKIIKKVFELKGNPNWYELNGKPNKKKITYTRDNAVRAIVKLGTEKTQPTYGTVDPSWGKLLAKGPKLAATLLENKHSYLITEDPICAEFCGVYKTATLDEAEKLKLFVENNEVLRQIQRRLKTKGLFWTFRHLKPFDLKQIKTGTEVPAEWNLTQQDLEELAK
jgi:tRNA1(Val) A37 N6-methylase TrmN6